MKTQNKRQLSALHVIRTNGRALEQVMMCANICADVLRESTLKIVKFFILMGQCMRSSKIK